MLGTSYAEHPGGKGLNQAVAAARAGAATTFVGAVGDDDAGRTLLDVLDREGIDRSAVRRVVGPTGRALIVVSDTGENSIVVVPGANAAATAGDLPPCDVLLVQLELSLNVVAGALRAAREAGVTTVLNPAPAAVLDNDVITCCDVVVPNEHELEALGGVDALLARGAGAVVVTRGAAGADVCTAAGAERVAALGVDAIDTTGAGDAFCGTLATALASGATLIHAALRASAAGSLATTRHGAVQSMPTAAEVDAALGDEHLRRLPG